MKKNGPSYPFTIIGSAQTSHDGVDWAYPPGTPVIVLTLEIETEKGYEHFLKTFRLYREDEAVNRKFLESIYSARELEKFGQDERWLWDRNNLIGREGICQISSFFGLVRYPHNFQPENLLSDRETNN